MTAVRAPVNGLFIYKQHLCKRDCRASPIYRGNFLRLNILPKTDSAQHSAQTPTWYSTLCWPIWWGGCDSVTGGHPCRCTVLLHIDRCHSQRTSWAGMLEAERPLGPERGLPGQHHPTWACPSQPSSWPKTQEWAQSQPLEPGPK